jgi:cytochrome P450
MGPRVCIGRRFSEMEMILILAKSMMKFRISPTKDFDNIKEKIAFTMRPSQAIKVNIKSFKA